MPTINAYAIVASQSSSTPAIDPLVVPDGGSFTSYLGGLYVRHTATVITPGQPTQVSYSYTPLVDIIVNKLAELTKVILGGSGSYTNTLTNSEYTSGSFSVSYGYRFGFKLSSNDSNPRVYLNIAVRKLIGLSKDDEILKVGDYYTQSTSWTAVFDQTNYDGTYEQASVSVSTTGSQSSGYKNSVTYFTDTASYTYGGVTKSGSRTIAILDAYGVQKVNFKSSVTVDANGSPILVRSATNSTLSSLIESIVVRYSSIIAGNRVTKDFTIASPSVTAIKGINQSVAYDGETLLSASFSFKNNQYTTSVNGSFGYKVTDTLQSISLSGQTTKFYTNEEFSFDGVVTPTYSSGLGEGSQSVTISASSPDMATGGVKTVTITYTDSDLGTSKTRTYYITVVEVSFFRIESQKTDFIYGDVAEYGENAVLKLYNSQGSLVESGSLADYIDDGYVTIDQKIDDEEELTNTSNVYLNGGVGQAKISTYFVGVEDPYEYLIYVTFADSFELSIRNLGNIYVDYNTEESLSSITADITAQYKLHTNTKANGAVVTEISVSHANLTASRSTITATSDSNNERIDYSYTDPTTSQELSSYASFNVIINKFASLKVSVTSQGGTYYRDRSNTFKIPTLAIKKAYSNPDKADVDLSGGELATVQYKASNSVSAASLSAGDTLSPSVTDIYVFATVDDGTGTSATLVGSYEIDYTTDTITSINFGKSFNFKLGNKPSRYKDSGDCVLIAHYASGYVTNDTDDIFTDYAFVQYEGGNYIDYDAVITASGGTFYVKSNGSYFALGYEAGVSITYVAPTGTITISGYQSIFVNNVDLIDFTNVTATITYADADPSTSVTLALDSGNTPTASTYALSCTTSENQNISAFDGTESFNLQNISGSSTETIGISAKNRFDTSVSITSSFTVSVVIIPGSITHIVVRNAKTEYSIGESFLNSTDGAVVDWYESGSQTPRTISLRNAPSVFGTDPTQGTVFTKTNDSMIVTVRVLSNPTIYTTYNAKVVSAKASSITDTKNIVAVLIPNGSSTGIEDLDNNLHSYKDASGSVVVNGWYILVDASNTEIDANGERVLAAGITLSSIKIYGYLEDAFNTSLSARVILFDDYIPPVSGESNIEVKFPCYVPGNADKINKCHIAKLFGNANAKNRLFASGNKDYKNCDWHSGAVNSYIQQGETMDANGDFSYFGDMDYCFYGQTDNEIMGYDHVATDKMVVLKSKSKVEPTNYFRSSTLIQAIDASGNEIRGIDGSSVYSESFPLATGNIGAGMMNRNAIVNLNGDTLFLSSNKDICGLNIAGQIGDSQRISYSRSRYIDPELKDLDLSDAVLWTDNESLYLFTDKVAYMTNYETFNEESGQYEWFKLDIEGARCAIDIDGVTYFGTQSGSLFRFEESTYFDCKKIFIEAGGTLYVTLSTLFSENKIVYSESVNPKIEDGAEYLFSMKPSSLQTSLFRKVASVSKTEGANIDLIIDYENNCLRIVAIGSNGQYDGERDAIIEEELACGCKFYLNYADGDSAIAGDPTSPLTEYYRSYTLRQIDSESGKEFRLIDADGNAVELKSGGIEKLTAANLCRVLDGQYDVIELDKEECSFKLSHNGRELDIVRYANQSLAAQSFASELHKHAPVKSFFIAAPATLGSISYRKTIWAWTLSAFKGGNDLKVCQATNEQNLSQMASLAFADEIPIGLNLADMSFGQFDLEKAVVPRKHTYIRPISVPFVAFGFKSDKAANSVLTSTSIVYTTPMLGWGNK